VDLSAESSMPDERGVTKEIGRSTRTPIPRSSSFACTAAFKRRRPGVANTIFVAVITVIVIVAAVATYGAYSVGSANSKAEAATTTTTISNSGGQPPGGASTSSVRSSSTTYAGGGPGATPPSEGISLANAMALMRTPLASGSVSQSNDSITFAPSLSSINITAFVTTQVNATIVTGMRPPSYAQGDVFVIGGLVDPTLNIPAGASVAFTIVNMDAANYNDLVVSTVGPPFAANLSQYATWHGMGMMGNGFQGFLYMMSVMDPANYAAGWASSYSYTVTIPRYADLWYLCTYPGHAMDGMYGEIITTRGNNTASSSSGSSTSTTTSQYLPSGTMPITTAQALLKTPPVGATVSTTANSIAFTSNDINLTVFAMMPDNATNLTGMKPPSYAQDDVFVIGGLIDPTLHIPKGATVHLTVINLDDDMYHDFVATTLGPPYPYMMMQGMMWGRGNFLYMMPVLSPANYVAGWAPVYSYTMTIPNVMTLWYLCTYPGHAEAGMYGEIVTS
jgi:rusticyanin